MEAVGWDDKISLSAGRELTGVQWIVFYRSPSPTPLPLLDSTVGSKEYHRLDSFSM